MSGTTSCASNAQNDPVLDALLVQVPGVGVEDAHLVDRRLSHPRMTVADVRHVVVGVEVAAAPFIPQVLHPAPFDP